MKLSPRTTATFTLGLLTVGLLAGCGGQTTVAPGEMSIQTASPSREAAGLAYGSYWNLANDSGETITITDLDPGSSDSVGLGPIPTGGTAYIEGGNIPNVQLEVAFPDTQSFRLIGDSSGGEGGEPIVKTEGDLCGWITLEIGSAANWFYKNHGFTIKREPDTDHFQLRITFTKSKASGSRDICVSGDDTIS